MKYWTEEKIKSAKYDEVIKELREILEVYHYKSKDLHISKDVVTSLENLLGSLLK
jgi:archaellum component FlaC